MINSLGFYPAFQKLWHVFLIACLLVGGQQSYADASNDILTVNHWDAAPEINYTKYNSLSLSGTRKSMSAIYINGEQRVTSGDSDWRIPFTNLVDGRYEYSIVAIDDQGQSSSTIDLVIIVDTQDPSIIEFIPAHEQAITEPLAQMVVAVTETGSGLDLSRSIIRIRPKQAAEDIYCSGIDSSSDCWLSTNQNQDKLFANFSSPLTDGIYERNGHSFIYDNVGNSYQLQSTYRFYINTTGILPIGAVKLSGRGSELKQSPKKNSSIYTNNRLSGTRYPQTAVYLNGEEIVPIGAGDWSYQFRGMAQGEHNWAIKWVDASGKESETLHYTLLVDSIAPTATIVMPQHNSVATSPVSQIELDVVETGSGLNLSRSYLMIENRESRFDLRCSGTDSTSNCWLSTNKSGNKLFANIRTPLLDGKFDYLINLYDNVGLHRGYSASTFYVNTTGIIPVGTASPLGHTRNHRFKTIDLSGLRYPQTAVYLNGEEIVPIGSSYWSYKVTDMAEGEHHWAIKWVDANGNESETLNYTFFVDSITPTVTVVAPQHNSVTTSPISQIEMDVVETGSGISLSESLLVIQQRETNARISCPTRYSSRCRLTTNQAGDKLFANFNPPLADGEYYVDSRAYRAYLKDKVGNSQRFPDRRFYINTSGVVPLGTTNITKKSPEINYRNSKAYTLSGKRYPQTAVYLNDKEIVPIGTGDWNYRVDDMAEGEHHWAIKWVDANGKASDALNYTLFVDTIHPKLTGMNPPDGGEYPQLDSLVVYSNDNQGSGLNYQAISIRVYKNGRHLFNCNVSFTESTSCRLEVVDQGIKLDFPYILDKGRYDLSFYNIEDIAGNKIYNRSISDDRYRFTITGQEDNTPPSKPTLNPYASPTDKAQITLSGSKEPYSYIVINGQKIEAGFVSDQWSATVDLQPGTNDLRLLAQDFSNNESDPLIAQVVFNDTPPGTVNFTAQSSGDGTSLFVDWAAYDEYANGADIQDYLVYLSEQPFARLAQEHLAKTVANGATRITLSGLTVNTTYYVAVVARDRAGQTSADYQTVEVVPFDTTKPYNARQLSATVVSDTEITLSWLAPLYNANDAANYRVQLNGQQLVELPATTLSYTIDKLSPATVYQAKVITVDAADNVSEGAPLDIATPFANPHNLSTTEKSNTVDLRWQLPSPTDGIANLRVYVSENEITHITGMTPTKTISAQATSTTVGGLKNNVRYYFAVTSVNLSGYETPTVESIAATPSVDEQGPTITTLRYGNDSFSNGYRLSLSQSLCVELNDASPISRVVFSIDDRVLATDAKGSDGYCYGVDLATLSDGDHSVEIKAYDVYDNMSHQQISVSVQLAAPAAPQITQPANAYQTNQAVIDISGKTQPGLEVQLVLNDQPLEWLATNATGQFSQQITLAEGSNRLFARARNRSGAGEDSAPLRITRDSSLPPQPQGLRAESLENGKVRLHWAANLQDGNQTFDLYRSDTDFDQLSEATKVNSVLIHNTAFDDVLFDDGRYVYRVVAVNTLGTQSLASASVSVLADATAPVAESIVYTTNGAFDNSSQTYGQGELSVQLTVSEPLLATPFLSIAPNGGTPISVPLVAVSGEERQYQGRITLNEQTPSGLAYAIFSGRDQAGNRGTDILAGEQLTIDTAGPRITRLSTNPSTPIQNSSSDPVSIEVTIELDEVLPTGETPTLGYQLSHSQTETLAIENLENPEAGTTWTGRLTLSDSAGLEQPESLQFTFSASDALGNRGEQIDNAPGIQIYQGDLPPLATPFNFRGRALSGGRVQLDWFAVDDVVAYQLYRKAPGEAELTAYQRLPVGDRYIDTTDTDGDYEYRLASIRQDNQQEALSAPSDTVAVSTDSQPPSAPSNLALELTPIGIQTSWEPVPESNTRYRLYRAESGPIVSTQGLSPVLDELVEPYVVDTQASQQYPAYAVVAIDAYGNESAPSNTAYLNVDLLPVASIKVRRDNGQAPVVSWRHSRSTINQFDLFLGRDENGIKLNDSTLTQAQYTDIGYANNQRDYAVVAIDSNSQRSLARTIRLPNIALSVAPDQRVKRQLINAVNIRVSNLSDSAIHHARVHLLSPQVAGGKGDFQSAEVSIPAGESITVPVIVAGLSELPDIWEPSLELHIAPNAGETIEIAQSASLAVQDGALGLSLNTSNFIQGADAQLSFELENTSAEAVQLITARSFGKADTPDIVFTLVDADDNVLSSAPFRQALGADIVNTRSGEAIATIPAQARWESAQTTLSIPANAPEDVFLVATIKHLYAHRGQAQEVRIKGPQLRQRIVLTQPPYTGTVSQVSPARSFGDQPIIIRGQAIDSETNTPLADVDLNLVISASGYERIFSITTDQQGDYEYRYVPQNGESGRYKLSILHPLLSSRPVAEEFIINRLGLSPDRLNLSMPYLSDYQLPITLSAGEGTELTNLRFALRPEDQPNGQLPEGMTILYPEIPRLSAGQPLRRSLTFRAEESALDSGQLFIAVFADESPDEAIAMIDIIYRLSSAKPALYHAPNILELGTTLDGTASDKITLENRGLIALNDVNVQLKTRDGFPADNWLKLITPANIGTIAVGAKQTLDIVLQPNNQAPVGTQRFILEVQSSNAPTRHIPITTAISESGEGGLLVKVTDMYTGTLNHQGQVIQGLQSAEVRLQNEALPAIQYDLSSDEFGEVFIENIPAGRYTLRVSEPAYQEAHLRLRIQPGLIRTEQVFLDYQLIKLSWSVDEITLQDKYEITLKATFQTDVPAAVVMLEPTSIALPPMEPGEVFYGELTMTNYGLIRAYDINFTPQESDEFFQYDYLIDVIPNSLEAKESVVIPYKVTALKSLEQQDSSGGGCGVYTQCSGCNAKSNCASGISETSTKSCVTRSYGSCASGPSTPSRPTYIDNAGGGGGGGGGGSDSDTSSSLPSGSGFPACRAGSPCAQ